MNAPAPLTPDSVDALLSAELDGDFEAAARDLGLDPPAARAQLDATPGVTARRAALTSARDLIASRPEVETSVVDRMVAAALAADDLTEVRDRRNRRARQWKVLAATGSVAAAIAVIVGIASMSTPSSSNSKASANAATTTENPKSADAEAGGVTTDSPTPALGDITRAASLRVPRRGCWQRPHQRVRKAPNPWHRRRPPWDRRFRAHRAVPRPGDALFAQDASPACTAARLRSYDVPSRPALIASGTVKGSPVVILIYDGNGSPYAYVIRVRDCALVRRQPLG